MVSPFKVRHFGAENVPAGGFPKEGLMGRFFMERSLGYLKGGGQDMAPTGNHWLGFQVPSSSAGLLLPQDRDMAGLPGC